MLLSNYLIGGTREAGVVILSFKGSTTILLIGSDTSLGYLLGRYVERSGYQLSVNQRLLSVAEVETINPAVIIFLSIELLETSQALVGELANHEMLIMVCSSVADEAKAMKLGTDYCLSHPLTYDNFHQALVAAGAIKGN
jgi:ActR/RegA family two-component response regulator